MLVNRSTVYNKQVSKIAQSINEWLPNQNIGFDGKSCRLHQSFGEDAAHYWTRTLQITRTVAVKPRPSKISIIL